MRRGRTALPTSPRRTADSYREPRVLKCVTSEMLAVNSNAARSPISEKTSTRLGAHSSQKLELDQTFCQAPPANAPSNSSQPHRAQTGPMKKYLNRHDEAFHSRSRTNGTPHIPPITAPITKNRGAIERTLDNSLPAKMDDRAKTIEVATPLHSGAATTLCTTDS